MNERCFDKERLLFCNNSKRVINHFIINVPGLWVNFAKKKKIKLHIKEGTVTNK